MGEWSVRLADGTPAGSTLTMDPALRNLVGLGLDRADAATATVTPSLAASCARDPGVLRDGGHARACPQSRSGPPAPSQKIDENKLANG